jgi:hypothetical protein
MVSSTTAVEVELKQPEELPIVKLEELRDGRIRGASIPFGLLLLVRAPELNPLKDLVSLPLHKTTEVLLHEYAAALRLVGGDVLMGDFTVFPLAKAEGKRQMENRTKSKERFVYF